MLYGPIARTSDTRFSPQGRHLYVSFIDTYPELCRLHKLLSREI